MKEEFKNPYDRLLVRDDTDTPPSRKYVGETLWSGTTEKIEILLENFGNGRWAAGYQIVFGDGRSATRLPSLEYGYCRSERDCKLWFLGLCLEFRKTFSDDAVAAIKAKIMDLAQGKLS